MQRRSGSATTPRGRAVSSALILPPGALPRDQELRALLATIDAVHGDGALPALPVRWGVPDRGAVAQCRVTQDLGEAVSLTIDPNRSRWPLATVLEVGHFIDHRGIGAERSMASRSSRLLSGWRRAVRQSRAYRTLRDAFGAPPYLADEEELWARSYAQWIAARSGDQTLRTQVVQSRGPDSSVPAYFGQWDDDDFEPIAAEIALLFRRLGWIG